MGGEIMQRCLLLALLPGILALRGVDVSQFTHNFSCLRQEGFDFAIVRGLMSSGAVDLHAQTNIANAKAAGLEQVDVYLFPCVPCGNPEEQVEVLWKELSGSFGRVWLDIEAFHWSSNKASNQDFISALEQALLARGALIGVYTNFYNWESIVGEWQGLAQYPLWYAHFDGKADFNDFQPFGGWESPTLKQYDGSTVLCGGSVDLNYHP